MGSRFLTLSLFIMMLSFFIVMDSFSTFEHHKTKDLLQSVSKAFSSKPRGATFIPQIEGGGGDVDKNPLDRLDTVFQNDAAGDDIKPKTNRLRTTMRVRLPVGKFEDMIAAADSNFLGVLASVFDANGKTSYTMKMVLNMAASPAVIYKQDPQKMTDAIKRTSSYVQEMEDAGLPADALKAGLGEGPDGTIDLYFQRRVLGLRAETDLK